MNIKALVIDDDEISIMLTEILLKDLSFFKDSVTFLDGSYALEYLKNAYSKSESYVIILDINMPLMNGWKFLEEIEKFTSQNNISVFMLSSSTDKADTDKAKTFPLVKGFFSKPLKNKDLNTIETLVNQKK